MSPKDYVNFVMGALAMAEGEDGGVLLSPAQYEKLKQRYDEMIQESSSPSTTSAAATSNPLTGRPPGARC